MYEAVNVVYSGLAMNADELRKFSIRAHDLMMLATAANYDLRVAVERRRSNADLEHMFFRLVRGLAPSVFIEAGAKDARSSVRAKRYCPESRAVAFEANPYTYERFSKKNASEDIEYLHLALSTEPGSVSFNVRRREDGGVHADGQGSLLKREDHAPGYEEVTVEATSLDAFFAPNDEQTFAMWVDVEGASQHVLEGARAVLARTAVVIVEVEDHAFWGEGCWLAMDVAAHLSEFGLVAVARDYQSKHQYNVVFVRAELLEDENVRYELARFRSAIGVGGAPLPLAAQGTIYTRAKKLTNDPQQFFEDSSVPFVRGIGKLIWR